MKKFYFGAAVTMMMLCSNSAFSQQRITNEQIQPVLDKLELFGQQNPAGAFPVDKLTTQEAALFRSYQLQKAQDAQDALYNPYGITDEEMTVKISPEIVAPILAKIDQLGNSVLPFPEDKFTRQEMKTLRIYELQNATPSIKGEAGKLITKAYALNARLTPKPFGTLTLTAPIAFTQIATTTLTIYADDIAGDGKLYALDNVARTLVRVNNAGVVTTVATLSGIPTADTLSGLSWNSANGTMYVLAASNIYTLNMTTGAATLVGATGLTVPIWLEINSTGNAYTADVGTDKLYSVNLTTGATTEIGALGININFAQEVDFNKETNVLHMAAYTGGGGGGIYTVNTTTGVATLLGDTTPLNAEFTMFSLANTTEPVLNQAYDLRGYPLDPANFGTTLLSAPGTQTVIGTLPTTLFADDIAGDGVLYALKNDTKQLVRINGSGTLGIVGPLTGISVGDTVTGLSWNRATGKMYAITSGGIANLYTINLTTGAATLVGAISNSPVPLWLEIDNAGMAYFADAISDNLFSLNLTTGVSTIIGALGIDINFAQEADFNTADNKLYMAAFLSDFSNGVYSVNISTGAATLVGATANEITMFSIADSLVNYLAVDNVNSNKTNIYPNPTTGILNIGASGKIDSVEVFNMVGQKVMSSTPKSDRAVIDMSSLSKGVYMIKASVNGNVTTNKVIKK